MIMLHLGFCTQIVGMLQRIDWAFCWDELQVTNYGLVDLQGQHWNVVKYQMKELGWPHQNKWSGYRREQNKLHTLTNKI
jgi:hypothetical protein